MFPTASWSCTRARSSASSTPGAVTVRSLACIWPAPKGGRQPEKEAHDKCKENACPRGKGVDSLLASLVSILRRSAGRFILLSFSTPAKPCTAYGNILFSRRALQLTSSPRCCTGGAADDDRPLGRFCVQDRPVQHRRVRPVHHGRCFRPGWRYHLAVALVGRACCWPWSAARSGAPSRACSRRCSMSTRSSHRSCSTGSACLPSTSLMANIPIDPGQFLGRHQQGPDSQAGRPPTRRHHSQTGAGQAVEVQPHEHQHLHRHHASP